MLDPSLVFPVPEDGSPELELMVAGPEMFGFVKPQWPGFYIRQMPNSKEWIWNEFLDDGYWAVIGIFEHQFQELPWRGAILKATENMIEEIENLKQSEDFNE